MFARLAAPVLLCTALSCQAQYFGVLGGLQRSYWRTPGRTLATYDRLEVGGSTTFQAYTNLAVRSELAFGIGLNDSARSATDRFRVTTMARFYPRPKLYAMLGLDLTVPLGRTSASETTPQATVNAMDLALFIGGGVRVTGRTELGLRAGTGLLAKVEVPTFGVGRDHPISLLYSYLIGGHSPGFTRRRQWRGKSPGGAWF